MTTTLVGAVQKLFERLLSDPATSFPRHDRVVGFVAPALPSETLRQITGQWPSPQIRWLPQEDFVSEVLQGISAWPELECVVARLSELAVLNDLSIGLKAGLAQKIVRAVMFAHCESQISPGRILGFGGLGTEPMVRPLHAPLFDARVVERAATVVANWEDLFAAEKTCTLVAPLQGLHLSPETPHLDIDDNTTILHIGELPVGLVLRMRSEYRSALIRGTDTAYSVIHQYRPAERARVSMGDTGEAREFLLSVTAAIRLTLPPSWLACPMYVVVPNLPWLEPRAEVINQNLPWGGMTLLPATDQQSAAIRHYLQALGDPTFPALGRRSSVDEDYEYVVWALKQVAALSTAVDQDVQASHLLMALDSLLGGRNTLGSWKALTNKLLILGDFKTRGLAKILDETYGWRTRLFHDGITPSRRFFEGHSDELWRLILAILRWILDNKQRMDLRTKAAFAETVRKCSPHAIRLG